MERLKLKNEFVLYAIISLILIAVVNTFSKPELILQNLGAFNSTNTAILGFLSTILAIIYTFESSFEENKAVKILKNQNKYRQITNIFTYSVVIIFLVWIYTFFLTIFPFYTDRTGILVQSLSGLTIVGFILVIGRVSKCILIFKLLGDAIKSQEE